MRTLALTLLLSTMAVSCAAPSQRIATGLQRYGLDEGRAACVGKRLERELSLGLLQQLGRAANAYSRNDPDPTRLTIGDFIRVAGQVRDPKVALEVGKAAAGCNVLP